MDLFQFLVLSERCVISICIALHASPGVQMLTNVNISVELVLTWAGLKLPWVMSRTNKAANLKIQSD